MHACFYVRLRDNNVEYGVILKELPCVWCVHKLIMRRTWHSAKRQWQMHQGHTKWRWTETTKKTRVRLPSWRVQEQTAPRLIKSLTFSKLQGSASPKTMELCPQFARPTLLVSSRRIVSLAAWTSSRSLESMKMAPSSLEQPR